MPSIAKKLGFKTWRLCWRLSVSAPAVGYSTVLQCGVFVDSSLVSEASRAARRVLSTAEEEVLAGSLHDLTKEGWELNRDSVRVVLHIYLHMIGKKRE